MAELETNAIKSMVEELLSSIPEFVDNEKHLKVNVIKDYAERGDMKLIELLLKNKQTKKTFFTPVLDSFVFNTAQFKEFLEYNSGCNSYSKYLGQIGLYSGDLSLIDRDEVVLNFPFKDCVLEGGQRKEDGEDSYYEYDEENNEYVEKQGKRREVFFNEVLARDEIDNLFSPKAFCNAKRFELGKNKKVKESVFNSFNRDAEINKKRGLAEDTITDNLIIKGNNLLALQSLKEEFAEKVKLVYTDSPYYFTKPKPNDTFCYNSNFRLSTWLVFMRDRLKLAWDLLENEGILLCHIKEDAIHWLKVLMEELFGAKNFVETFIWKNTDNPDSLSNKSRSAVEYIICFEKNKNTSQKYIGKNTENGDAPILHTGNSIHNLTFPKGSIKFNIGDGTYQPGKPDRVELITPVIVKNGINTNEVVLRGEFTWAQETLEENWNAGCYFLVKSKKFSVRVQMPQEKAMAPEKFIDEQYLSKAIGVGSNEDASTHLKNMGINFTNSKPESVVAFFVRAMTQENDLIMDFFLGSGTTAAVAQKMNRQYIGVDQMDYIETETLRRMKKVLEGENGGISKSVNWQGGGSFVYLELAKKNEMAMEQISACKSYEELVKLFKTLCTKYFLHYNVRVKEFCKEIESIHFKKQSLKKQKEMFARMLDLNQLYVNVDDRKDKSNGLSENDIAVTEDFYQLKKGGK